MSIFTYHEDYKGKRWTYALTLRPVARFNLPDEGWIVGSQRPHSQYKTFGTVDYSRQLTEEELYRYDMIFIGESDG